MLDKEALIQGSDGGDGDGDSGDGDGGAGGGEGEEEMETLATVEVVGVRDAVGHHFTMELSSGATLHCHLPPLYPHPTGSHGTTAILYVYTHLPMCMVMGMIPYTIMSASLRLASPLWYTCTSCMGEVCRPVPSMEPTLYPRSILVLVRH